MPPEQVQSTEKTVQTPETPEAPQVNWETKYQEDIKKYDGFDTYKNVAETAYSFLQKHPEIADGYKQFTEGKDWKPTFAEKKEVAELESKFNPDKFRQEVRDEALRTVRDELTPIYNATQEREAKEEEKYAKDKYGYTDVSYAELDKKFVQRCESEIKERMFRGESKQQATENVRSIYRNYKIDHIIALLEPEKLAATVGRKPQPLAPGMTSPGNNAGPAPKVLEQARKEYGDAPKGDASATVVKKWAGEFGLTMADAHKLLQGE